MISLIQPFILGAREAGGGVGMTYDDDPESPRSRAYDEGRNLGQTVLHTWWSILDRLKARRR